MFKKTIDKHERVCYYKVELRERLRIRKRRFVRAKVQI